MKGNRKYIIVLVLTLALAIFAEASAPKQIDWSPSYSRVHKTPYGAYALFEMFKETLPEGFVRTNDEPIYNAMPSRVVVADPSDADYDHADTLEYQSDSSHIYADTAHTNGNSAHTYADTSHSSFLIFNDEFEPDELDRSSLLGFVELGNTAFIAADNFGFEFLDSLGISTDGRSLLLQGDLDDFLQRDTVLMSFVNPALRTDTAYPIRVGRDHHWFTELDTARTTILGQDNEGRPNFIRVERGSGIFLLSTLPRAFTNFNVLNNRNREYAFAALSYLPRQHTIWDEYYKTGRIVSSSPMRFVLGNRALRWAWFAALIGVALFVFVYGRRRQRAIPVVTPPSNTTLEFTETVGRLYFQHGDHRGIAVKKVAYFHEYLRSHLGIRITDAERDVYRRIAERSGVTEDRVRSIFSRILHLNRTSDFDSNDLRGLNNDLEQFYSTSKR